MLAAIAGIISGTLGALGMGGGAVLMIYLTGFTTMSQLEAQGCNLIFFLPCAITATVLHHRNSLVSWKMVGLLAPGGMVGTLVGVFLSHRIPSVYLQKIFALFLILVAVRELMAKDKRPEDKSKKLP